MKKKQKKTRKPSSRPKGPIGRNMNNRRTIGQLAGRMFELEASFGQLLGELQDHLRPIAQAHHVLNAVCGILAKEATGRDLTEDERDALAEFLDGPDEEPTARETFIPDEEE